MRQALAGMMWSKQFYYYDVNDWLAERGADPFKPRATAPRNDQLAPHAQRRHHLDAGQVGVPVVRGVGSGVPCARADAGRRGLRQAPARSDAAASATSIPTARLPAYEWNFGDVNPPVHAWSTIFTYRLEQAQRGQGDVEWLERSFQKLLLNFTWWVNRKDRSGNNVFEGGFLGLDNIGVFDRELAAADRRLPRTGGRHRVDGALLPEHARDRRAAGAASGPPTPTWRSSSSSTSCWIASSMIHAGGDVGMWDEEDGFFYDVLRLPDGRRRAAEGALDGRAAAALRRHRLRAASC